MHRPTFIVYSKKEQNIQQTSKTMNSPFGDIQKYKLLKTQNCFKLLLKI